MDIRDELTRAYGPEIWESSPTATDRHVWTEICVCGHLGKYHGEPVGGSYATAEPETKTVRGQEVLASRVLDGCAGAPRPAGTDRETAVFDAEAKTYTTVVRSTCPCLKFQPVATVDRANHMFNQRVPAEHEAANRHPFAIGVRALLTHLGKRKAAQTDETWVGAEFDRRFRWLDRRCAISSCTTADDVWPVFVDGDRSELRCPQHR